MFDSLKKRLTIFTIVPLVCFLFYFVNIKTGFGPFDFGTHLNYFRLLADAFLHGRLDLIHPSSAEDLIVYQEKFYLYWPPVPALVYTPLVAVFGKELPDTFINTLFGVANVWLLMKICLLFEKKYSLGLTLKNIGWIGLFWGLGTVHFYMSKDGTVWFISQIMAQTFLLFSVYILLSKKDNTGTLLLSGLFFAMAIYTRNHLVFSIFFFILLYLSISNKMTLKKLIVNGFIFTAPFILFSCLNGWYNFARFGNVFENGIRYHVMSAYFYSNYIKYGYFSWHYFSYNFFIEVLHFPEFLLHRPFIEIEKEGFGFLWGSPVFLLLIPASYLSAKNLFTEKTMERGLLFIKLGSIISTVFIACTIFLIMGTGWVQFCARYTLDFYFFLIIFLIFLWKKLKAIPFIQLIIVCLILMSILIQGIGAWQFSKL